MGNFFSNESQPEPVGESPNENQSAKAENGYYLTESEKAHLRMYYEMIYTEPNGATNRDGLKVALHREANDLIVESLAQWLESKNLTDYEHFEATVIEATRISSAQTIKTLWEVSKYCTLDITENQNELFRFCKMTLLIISDHEHVADLNEVDRTAELLQEFYMSKAGEGNDLSSNLDGLIAIIHEYTPHIAKAFHTYLSMRLLLAEESPSFKPYLPPLLSYPSETTSQLLLNTLALYCEELQSDWNRLYSTTFDGLSFDRISHQILGYEGPICIIIKCSNPGNSVFGMLTMDKWREHTKFFGSPRTTLFTISPRFSILKSKVPNTGAYQWLNSKSFGIPHGMGFGGTQEEFRVFIPDSLESCIARDTCLSFEDGRLIAEGESFEIATLEIWGCGGNSRVERAMKAQTANRQVVDEALAKARKVDKAQFFDNSFDREFLLSNTFAHDKEKQDRLEEY